MRAIQSEEFYVANSRYPRSSRPVVNQGYFSKNVAGLGGFQYDLLPLIVLDEYFDIARTDNIERVPGIAVVENALSGRKLEQVDPLCQGSSLPFANLT